MRDRRIGNKNALIHGECRNKKVSAEWLAWKNMKDRCYKENNDSYYRYGGRGIVVCDSWKESFECFLNDMGRKPSPKHSLDRINYDGHYEKHNCRWATSKEQQNNRSTNRIVTFNELSMTIQQWAEKSKMDKRTLLWRFRAGWNVEDCLTKPIKQKRKNDND